MKYFNLLLLLIGHGHDLHLTLKWHHGLAVNHRWPSSVVVRVAAHYLETRSPQCLLEYVNCEWYRALDKRLFQLHGNAKRVDIYGDGAQDIVIKNKSACWHVYKTVYLQVYIIAWSSTMLILCTIDAVKIGREGRAVPQHIQHHLLWDCNFYGKI